MNNIDKLEKYSFENGYLFNIDKPLGKTSFNVVYTIRKTTGIKKVGHAGTLDPLATGVLLVAAGKATKSIHKLVGMEKEYIGKVKFGVVTDTYDAEGRVLEENSLDALKESDIVSALSKFRGEILQTPPIYSALKVKGKPLYKYARQGVEVKIEPRKVVINEIELLSFDGIEAEIKVKCSKGTYIRSLAYDLGRELGCGAMLNGLVRTKIGPYFIENSINLDDFRSNYDEKTS